MAMHYLKSYIFLLVVFEGVYNVFLPNFLVLLVFRIFLEVDYRLLSVPFFGRYGLFLDPRL